MPNNEEISVRFLLLTLSAKGKVALIIACAIVPLLLAVAYRIFSG